MSTQTLLPGQPPSHTHQISLLSLFLIPSVLLLAIAVALSGYIALEGGASATHQVASQLRQETAGQIHQQLVHQLSTARQINNINATMIREGLVPIGKPEVVQRYFWNQLDHYPNLSSIYFGTSEGGLIDAGREGSGGFKYIIATEDYRAGVFRKYMTDASGNPTQLLVSIPDFDARTRNWYRSAIATRGVTWSDIYVLFTGQDMAIAASQPVFDPQGKLLGVVANDTFLSQINGFLQQLTSGQPGAAYIIERSGQLVATSTGEQLFAPVSTRTANDRLNGRNSQHAMVSESLATLTNQLGDLSKLTTSQEIEFEIEGKPHFARFTPFLELPGLDWVTVVVSSEEALMAEMSAARNHSIALMSLVLLLAVGIAVEVTRRIVRPLRSLNAAAHALTRGEEPAAIPLSGITEIRELEHSFDAMSFQLRQSLDVLTNEVTERERAEQELRQSESKYRQLVNHLHEIVFQTDCAGNWTYLNPAWTVVTGFKTHESLGKPLIDSVHAHDQRKHLDAFESLSQHTVAFIRQEIRLLHKDSGYRWVEFSARLTLDDEANVVGISGTINDITERKNADLALKVERSRLASVVDGTRAGTWEWNVQSGATVFNERWAEIVGYTLAELEPVSIDTWSKLAHPDDLEKSNELLQRHFAGELAYYDCEARMRHKSGEWIWVHDRGKVTTWTDDGKPLIMSGTHTDVTERVTAEIALRRAQKMNAVAQLTGGVAHDFNNLLGVVIGNLDLMELQNPRSSDLHQRIAMAKRAAQRAADLTKQLLAYSRHQFARTVVADCNQLIRSMEELIRQSVTSEVAVGFHLAGALWYTELDPSDLEDSLLNLVLNARDAMPRGGQLNIATTNCVIDSAKEGAYLPARTGDFVCLSVTDTGIGIPVENQDRIFEPFYSTKPRDHGTGLGLAMVYGFVQRARGFITVESEKGVGTTIRLYFPCTEKMLSTPKPQSSDPQSVETPIGAETILVVEDDKDLRLIAKDLLEGLGYGVLTAQDAAEAIQILKRKQKVDLVFTDVVMPGGVDGFELANRIATKFPQVKVLLTSGYSEHLARSQATVPEFTFNMLKKPYGLGQLAREIRHVLDRSPQDTGSEQKMSGKSVGGLWSDELALGIGAMDDDHRVVFDLLHQFRIATHEIDDPDSSVANLINLRAYIESHFKREEAVMASCGFKDLEGHRHVHRMLLTTLAERIEQYRQNEIQANELIAFLEWWWLDHLRGLDKAYAQHCAGQEQLIEIALNSCAVPSPADQRRT